MGTNGTPPLRGGWTRSPVGQMASPQPEGDLRDHTSFISPQNLFHSSHLTCSPRWLPLPVRSATLFPIRSHHPAPHGPSPLIFPPLHLLLFHSSILISPFTPLHLTRGSGFISPPPSANQQQPMETQFLGWGRNAWKSWDWIRNLG